MQLHWPWGFIETLRICSVLPHTVNPDGRCKIHKSKRNTNGTFSIGKTWNLEDLRALEVHVSSGVDQRRQAACPAAPELCGARLRKAPCRSSDIV